MFLAQLAGGGFNVLSSLQSAFTTLVNYLPRIIGALIVLVIGYLIAKLISIVISRLLRRFKVDDRIRSGPGGQYVDRISPHGRPSRLAGRLVLWVIMLFVLSSAIGTLQIPALTGFMNLVLSYLPRVIAALAILVGAAAVAAGAGGLAHRTMGDTPTGRMVRVGAPALILSIALFMILTQLEIAPAIVVITYATLLGGLALGGALAFGLGGREAAADMINSGYQRAQQQMEDVRRDFQTGRQRAEQQYRARREGRIPDQQRGDTDQSETARGGGSSTGPGSNTAQE